MGSLKRYIVKNLSKMLSTIITLMAEEWKKLQNIYKYLIQVLVSG